MDNIKTESKSKEKKCFIIKDDCPYSKKEVFFYKGEEVLPFEWLEEVSPEIALLNSDKAILLNFTNDEVKAFFKRD